MAFCWKQLPAAAGNEAGDIGVCKLQKLEREMQLYSSKIGYTLKSLVNMSYW